MGERYTIEDQLDAARTLHARYARKAFDWGDPKNVADFRLGALGSVIKTLEFVKANEQLIRDAIASAKALDAADTYS